MSDAIESQFGVEQCGGNVDLCQSEPKAHEFRTGFHHQRHHGLTAFVFPSLTQEKMGDSVAERLHLMWEIGIPWIRSQIHNPL